MATDSTQYHWIYREFSNKLDSFSRRVQEGKDVASALEFGKFVCWSGVIQLLQANSQAGPLTVDGSLLKWKCEELIRACQDRYSRNDDEPHLGAKDLQTLHEKLDHVAGYLSRLCASPSLTVIPAVAEADFDSASPGPDLTVINGGHYKAVHAADAVEMRSNDGSPKSTDKGLRMFDEEQVSTSADADLQAQL